MKVLMCYPGLGLAGSYVVNVPISLIYSVRSIVNISDLEVEIVDCRIDGDWRNSIKKALAGGDVGLVGVSVMSGIPVAGAYEISTLVKSLSDVPVVWGGAHPTILPEDTLNYGSVDYCIRGFGALALEQLVRYLLKESVVLEEVDGLCFKKDDVAHISKINDSFENIHFSEIPYYLIEKDIEKYFDTQKNRVFPIYTALGCPYQCSFCISPIMYKGIRKKWVPLDAKIVVDHIEYLQKRYGVDYVYFYDDDTFVKFSHFAGIAKELITRGIKVVLGVRGIRVNELEKMKDEDFELLIAAGVRNLHIGMETGSQRMLDLMKKQITVEQSLRINKKLMKYKQLLPMYNMLVGMPTETIEDLKQTGKFMLQLSQENPECIIFDPGKLVPYPGSELYDLAVEHGFEEPEDPMGWAKLDQEGEIRFPWYTDEYDNYIKMLQLASYALSNWERYLKDYPAHLYIFFKIAKVLYKPIAIFRIKTGCTAMLYEYWLYKKLSFMLAS